MSHKNIYLCLLPVTIKNNFSSLNTKLKDYYPPDTHNKVASYL